MIYIFKQGDEWSEDSNGRLFAYQRRADADAVNQTLAGTLFEFDVDEIDELRAECESIADALDCPTDKAVEAAGKAVKKLEELGNTYDALRQAADDTRRRYSELYEAIMAAVGEKDLDHADLVATLRDMAVAP